MIEHRVWNFPNYQFKPSTLPSHFFTWQNILSFCFRLLCRSESAYKCRFSRNPFLERKFWTYRIIRIHQPRNIFAMHLELSLNVSTPFGIYFILFYDFELVLFYCILWFWTCFVLWFWPDTMFLYAFTCKVNGTQTPEAI